MSISQRNDYFSVREHERWVKKWVLTWVNRKQKHSCSLKPIGTCRLGNFGAGSSSGVHVVKVELEYFLLSCWNWWYENYKKPVRWIWIFVSFQVIKVFPLHWGTWLLFLAKMDQKINTNKSSCQKTWGVWVRNQVIQ